MDSEPADNVHSRRKTISVKKGCAVFESLVLRHAVKLTMYDVPDKDIESAEGHERIQSIDLGERLYINSLSWSAPTKLTLTDSEQVRSDDGISISSSPGHRLLVRSLSALPKDGDRTKSTWIDLDPPGIEEKLRDLPSDVASKIRSLKGGGFRIDSIDLSMPSNGSRKVTIWGTRMPIDVKPETVKDEAEHV